MKRNNIFFSFAAFSLIAACLFFTDNLYAQKASVKRSGNAPRRAAKTEKAEKAAKARSAAAALKIRKQLSGKLVPAPMDFLGVSDSMSNLAARQIGDSLKPEDGPQMENERDAFSGEAEPSEFIAAPPSFLQTEAPVPLAATAGTSFEAPGAGMSGYNVTSAPPDTTLAVGPNHVVAWVNSNYAIFDKSGNKLLPGNGFVAGNTLFASLGSGNLCASTNRGDPILQYDRLANRWILSQFAFPAGGVGPYLQCIAVSTTADPTGQYYLYSFALPGGGFNDYGKLGVWTDAYYISYVVFTSSGATSSYLGSAVCAYDKVKMMAGQTANSLCGIGTYGGAEVFLPIDLDGSTAPTDTSQGGIFAGFSQSAQALRLIKLRPDFDNLTGTLDDGFGGGFGSFVSLPVGATTLACNNGGAVCIPQPGTITQLDSLGDRLMYRLSYRNRNGIDSLLVNQSVDPDGAGGQNSAVRWYEIRNPFGNPNDSDSSKRPFLYQNSTFNPNASGDRWMGSLAMDRFGNILMGYSAANATGNLKPSIAVTGRLQNDPLNAMRAETIVQTGGGSQNAGLTRWGDYTTMQIDPSDDTTFWYIGQYLAADGSFNWRSRVFSFKFLSGINGTVAYGTGAGKSVPSVTLASTGDFSATATSNNAGNYTLNLSTGGQYTITASKTGQVNGISAFDATLVLRHVAGGGTGPNALNLNQQIAADTNGSGTITSFDATQILRYVAAGAASAQSGQAGSWKFTPASKNYPALLASLTGENYTAILVGEVNGSWTPPTSAPSETETIVAN